jgi:hypothetical protein
MSNVVQFPGAAARRQACIATPDFDRAYPRRNSRNPLRRHLDKISIGITEANKIDHIHDKWLEWIRNGAVSARVVADALDTIVKQAEG